MPNNLSAYYPLPIGCSVADYCFFLINQWKKDLRDDLSHPYQNLKVDNGDPDGSLSYPLVN